MERLKLALFDLDGTIRTKEDGVPIEVKSGITHLWQDDVTTTVMTGRGYARLREMLKSSYNDVISQSPITPLGLETGARIADRNGKKNLKYYPLPVSEIQQTLETIVQNTSDVKLLAYYPERIDRRAVLWTPNSDKAQLLQEKYGHFADINTDTPSALEKLMFEDKPCMIAIQPETSGLLEAFPKGLNAVTNEGFINVNPVGIGKDTGTKDIAEILGVELSQVMVAGNDQNDVPFMNSGAGRKLWVGERVAGVLTIPDIIEVASPQELGTYLSTI